MTIPTFVSFQPQRMIHCRHHCANLFWSGVFFFTFKERQCKVIGARFDTAFTISSMVLIGTFYCII